MTSLAHFAVAAALVASAVFWGLKLFVRAPVVPPHTTLAVASLPAAPDWERLLGVELAPVVAEVAVPPPDTRYQLIGVVAPRGVQVATGAGVALIAVDGKPARAYRVGALIDGSLVLQSVQARSAALGPRGAPANVTLQMPPLPVAATSSLPPTSLGVTPGELTSVVVPPHGGPMAMPVPAPLPRAVPGGLIPGRQAPFGPAAPFVVPAAPALQGDAERQDIPSARQRLQQR